MLAKKTEISNKKMLNKWDYRCNQSLSYQKSFASAKTLKQDQDCI